MINLDTFHPLDLPLERPIINVFLLNGPKESGKDKAADYMMRHFGFEKYEFKAELYKATGKHYKIPACIIKFLNERRWLKEKKLPFFGKSVREMLISTSEHFIKPQFGNDYFGKKLARSIFSNYSDFWDGKFNEGGNGYQYPIMRNVIISDSGFDEELIGLHTELNELYDPEVAVRICVIKIFRPGKTFEGDSRKYLRYQTCEDLGIPTYECHNDTTLDHFLYKVQQFCIRMIYNQKNL